MDKLFPKKLTLLTVILTLGVIVGLGVQHWYSLKYTEELKDQHIPSTELSGMILHVDDILTDSTYLAVLTGFPRWTERYDKFRPFIEKSTVRYISLVEDVVGPSDIQRLTSSRQELFNIEGQVFELVKGKKREQAYSLLESQQYSDKKREYQRSISEITAIFATKRTETLRKQHLQARVTVIAFMVSLVVLMLTWLALLNVFRASERQRKRMYLQLAQAAKLASLGTLSSGVAHELRNPLTVVKGLAQHLEETPNSSPSVIKEYARQIVDESKRIENITNQLRSFAREGGSSQWTNLNINDVVNSSLSLLTQQLKNRGIHLTLNLSNDLPPIWGDPARLESIFHNLITNSRDAFETLEGDRDQSILIETRKDLQGIVIRYEDNAGGIPDNIKQKIFDPFFTTKGGRGTGLGLSIVHGIIEQHKGNIRVETQLGQYTRFMITLPQLNAAERVTIDRAAA